MTRLEKCEILKSAGYIYDAESGKIFGSRGKEIIGKDKAGYTIINRKPFALKAHHFAWYMIYDNVDFKELDHINRIKDDNRISNLRIASRELQMTNKNSKGYCWHKLTSKWQSQIQIGYKKIYLGLFDTKEEALNAYLQAKEKYHSIA